MLGRSGIVLAFCLLSTAPGFAQSPSPAPSPPLRGFVPPYEILRTVRAAGFEPLAPPLREGTTYVVRAIDFRGVAMRVVVDARSGAIRDANRIVSGPGLYGPYVPGPYGSVIYGRLPPSYPPDDSYGQPPFVGTTALAPSDRHFPGLSLVPVPRPRPASLATTSAAAAASAAPGANEKQPDPKSDSRPDVATSAPAATQLDWTSKPSAGPAIPAIND